MKIFGVFAAAYFLAAVVRAVTATLAPTFSADFNLGASDLGLLAGAYFLGFALLQLPLGAALDRWGPRRVELALVTLAVLGCVLFASAQGFNQLVVARTLIGMGVAACLMAPLTFFRLHFSPALQLRSNSWMLMTGSLGMMASTVPVQLLLPSWGWRGLFWALAVAMAGAALGLWRGLPRQSLPISAGAAAPADGRYRAIVSHPQFIRLAPLGLVLYGGLIAIQALWAGPWLTRVCGWSSLAASEGLLLINAGMLVAFLGWGWLMPGLARRGLNVMSLIAWGVPVSLLLLGAIAWLGAAAGALHWMAWCMATSMVALAQPALAQAFPTHMAGRALSAFNLVIFAGVFILQWGMGAAIDGLQDAGLETLDSFRVTMGAFMALCALSYAWFIGMPLTRAHNRATEALT